MADKNDNKNGVKCENIYPGHQYQNLFNWLRDKNFIALVPEMKEVISIVHRDFPAASPEQSKIDYLKEEIRLRDAEIETLKYEIKQYIFNF